MEVDTVASVEGSPGPAARTGVRRRLSPHLPQRRLSPDTGERGVLSSWAAIGLPVVCALWLLAAPATAWAATTGTATIIQPNTGAPLDSGGLGTAYGVSLPSGASCPGDTAHQGFHVYSYLVPAGHNPTEASYRGEFPSRWYGYISYGAYFGAVNTAEGTGQVMTLPQFSWTRYSSYLGELFPHGTKKATWEGGILCANVHGAVTNYWNTQIAFTRTSADPGGFTWRVVSPPPAGSTNTRTVVGITLLVVALLLGALAVFLSRRRGRADPESDEGHGPTSRPVAPDSAQRLPAPAGR